jgi:hypothetical protein
MIALFINVWLSLWPKGPRFDPRLRYFFWDFCGSLVLSRMGSMC